MFFYTALFVASVIASLIILYLYNSLKDVGKAVYRAFLPSSKEKLARQIQDAPYHSTINDTPTPWGWDGHASPVKQVKTASPSPSDNAPWGWKGGDHQVRENGSKGSASGLNAFGNSTASGHAAKTRNQARVGWPYREEKSESAGKAYKVTRKVTLQRTNLKTTSKPWGW
ncbi:MAG: hypothetical protein OEU84_02495 [Xanthomonadales bacterium]|nr:hypothetical protein [Xanthomonadales bacterium]